MGLTAIPSGILQTEDIHHTVQIGIEYRDSRTKAPRHEKIKRIAGMMDKKGTLGVPWIEKPLSRRFRRCSVIL